MQQLHRSDHCSNPERQCDQLDRPQTKIPVQKSQQRDVENRHQRADEQELVMRPRQQIGERITPPRENHRNPGYLQVAFQVFALGVG